MKRVSRRRPRFGGTLCSERRVGGHLRDREISDDQDNDDTSSVYEQREGPEARLQQWERVAPMPRDSLHQPS